MLREICFSSADNKAKLIELKFDEILKTLINKLKPEEKKIKFEAKILIFNITFNKTGKKFKARKSCVAPVGVIEKEKIIKSIISNYMIRGLGVKGVNPKGKVKDFILSFSPDLMKIYLKKPKMGVVPPKAKYTIETPLISEVVKNYQITNFRKSLLSNKLPEKHLCFAIVQGAEEKEKASKKLIIICNNDMEAYLASGCVEILTDFVKVKCDKKTICKIDDTQKFCLSLMANQPKENVRRRVTTVVRRGKI